MSVAPLSSDLLAASGGWEYAELHKQWRQALNEAALLRTELRTARLLIGALCIQAGGHLCIKKTALMELNPRAEIEMSEDPATGDYIYRLRAPS